MRDLDCHLGEVRHKVCILQLFILAKTTSINNSISIIIVHASTKLTRGGSSKLSLRSYVNGHLLSSKITFCFKMQHPYTYCMYPQRQQQFGLVNHPLGHLETVRCWGQRLLFVLNHLLLALTITIHTVWTIAIFEVVVTLCEGERTPNSSTNTASKWLPTIKEEQPL